MVDYWLMYADMVYISFCDQMTVSYQYICKNIEKNRPILSERDNTISSEAYIDDGVDTFVFCDIGVSQQD